MKLALLCAMLAPIIYLAFKYKKWYLYLAVAFIGILPEQLAVELHEKLPLLSCTRVLILVLAAFWLWDRWKTRNFKLPVSLVLFLGVNVVISAINLRNGFDEVNRVFLFVFERVLLVIMLADMIKNREEFERCLDFMIMGCTVLAIIGIVQNIFEYDIASVLHLRETLASITLSERMGMTRAYATFNAISFGCYCAFMLLPIYYRLEQTGKQRYAVAFALNFVALICTFTRSAWLCIGGVMLVLLIVRKGKPVRRLLSSAALVIVICVALCIVQPKLFGAFVETGKSSINTILDALPESLTASLETVTAPTTDDDTPAQTTDATEPTEATEPPEDDRDLGFTLSEDFGMNGEDPTYSRMVQWTAVEYMIEEGDLLFGYGYNAVIKGRLHYFYDRWGGRWNTATYLDVGLVALITECGLIGTVAHLLLLGFMFVYALWKKDKTDNFDFYKLTLYMIPLYLLLNFLAAFLYEDVVWLFIGMFYAYKALHSKGLTEEASQDGQAIPGKTREQTETN